MEKRGILSSPVRLFFVLRLDLIFSYVFSLATVVTILLKNDKFDAFGKQIILS